jgi:hypothetical protein
LFLYRSSHLIKRETKRSPIIKVQTVFIKIMSGATDAG